MKIQTFSKIKIAIMIFVLIIMIVAVLIHNVLLVLVGVGVSLLVLQFLKNQTKPVLEDERVALISQKTARSTYIITTICFGLTALLLIFFGMFGAVQFSFLVILGIIFAYLTLFMITVYVIAFYIFNRQMSS